jgi:NADH:ubiquinone oxidoreductase subunit K
MLNVIVLGLLSIRELRLINVEHKSIIRLLFILSLVKFYLFRNHLLNYLVIIEVYIVLMYFNFICQTPLLRSSNYAIFLFIVIMVCGACVAISLLVIVRRLINKELELGLINLNSN